MILKLIKRLFKRKKEILNTKQSNVLQRDIGRGSICVSGSDRTILLNGGSGGIPTASSGLIVIKEKISNDNN